VGGPPGHTAGWGRAAWAAGARDCTLRRPRARPPAGARDWEPVLHRFEQRLASLASPVESFGHASLA
jgi:hypothetical protein